MKVPFLDLSIQYNEIKDDLHKSLAKIYERSDFILGKEVSSFEEAFADYCDAGYAVGVNSGTDALFLGLKALGVDEGDEVIVPAFTYIASAFAVSYTGAKPVFCDIEEDTYNINPELIEEKITSKTKAIMPVHLYGHAADMKPIKEIAAKRNLKVIEDSAQAHGAVCKGLRIKNKGSSIKGKTEDKKQTTEAEIKDKKQKVGSIGDVGCFSFYPSKNLSAFGDGGIIVTNDKAIKEKIWKLRDYGRSDKYHHDEIGYNSRLDTVQAAVLKIKLKRLDEWNEARRKNASNYNELFKDMPEVIRPVEKSYARHIYHVYAIRVPSDKREKVIRRLQESEIGVIIHYPVPLHLQKAYENLGHSEGDFPVAEKTSAGILSLPMFPGMKREQIEYVVSKISDVLNSK
jgi:dTDP-4-amino-4,6-dideoxygalactose transaminase